MDGYVRSRVEQKLMDRWEQTVNVGYLFALTTVYYASTSLSNFRRPKQPPVLLSLSEAANSQQPFTAGYQSHPLLFLSIGPQLSFLLLLNRPSARVNANT